MSSSFRIQTYSCIATSTEDVSHPFHNAGLGGVMFATPQTKTVYPFGEFRGSALHNTLCRNRGHFCLLTNTM